MLLRGTMHKFGVISWYW